ncbi:MAG: HD domain-containing protein [Prevotellaceae bacterium]|jgi:GTP pyrophosphokinase|nr:HD domain-containing protein [Prevotellaceae bacterium]
MMEDHHYIEAAYKLAERVLAQEYRSNGTPFMEHVCAVIAIVTEELSLPPVAVMVVLLHEATRKHPELLVEVKQKFPPQVYSMVLGLNRISTINPNDTRLQADNYRKLIVAYSTNPIVVLIKLADRMEVMRSLSIFSKTQRERKATETLMLYAPLAHQLGLYAQKSELEDLAFQYSEPEEFKKITAKIKASVGARKQVLISFTEPIEEELSRAGFSYELKSRTKTAYSIWKKMQAQQVPFEGVFDILAIRIILDAPPNKEAEHDLCWRVYSMVTGLFTPDTQRLRDWLSHPRSNGYESLHITVSDASGSNVEVQIRTKRMDIIAESGMAAHWLYKGVKRADAIQEWLNRVRELLQSDTAPDQETRQFFSHFKMDEIFVFTPTGDLFRLPAGATVLDFAFAIHSNLGVKCMGAKIDNRVVPIREKLRTGDVVEVITSKNQRPSADWLQVVVTGKAKSKIKQQLRENEGKHELIGRELLERRLKNWKMELNDEVLSRLLRFFKFKKISDIYVALANEEIGVDKIKELLERPEEEPSRPKVKEEPCSSVKSSSEDDYLVIDNKLSHISYKIAKCCNPVFGDEVFGFISAKEGIKLHKKTCPNAGQLHEKYAYRVIQIQWKRL